MTPAEIVDAWKAKHGVGASLAPNREELEDLAAMARSDGRRSALAIPSTGWGQGPVSNIGPGVGVPVYGGAMAPGVIHVEIPR